MGRLINSFLSFLIKSRKQDIVRVFSLTAMSTLVKMCTGLISVKVVALIIGPAGIALLGQLNNFSAIIMSFAGGGINNGITKYVAEFRESNDKVKSLLSTALRVTLFCSLIIGSLLILFHRFLSELIMMSSEYGYVFIAFGFTLFLYALNMMLISIINGYKEFKKYVLINIIGSIVGLIFTLSFVFTLGLKGALISTVTFQSVMFFVTFFMIKKLPWVSWSYFKSRFDLGIAKKLSNYTLMSIATAATVPLSQIFLRGYVISEISPIEAGWWEGMNRLSGMYLLVITSSFSVYYLPRLSELKQKVELRLEIFEAYKVMIPMLSIGFFLIYICRFIIVRILFSHDFFPMTDLFLWQLIGDFFKIMSWLLAFLMVAKSMARTFIMTEIFFSLLFVLLGFIFMQYNGVIGITQAYMVNYIAYAVFMVILFRHLIFL